MVNLTVFLHEKQGVKRNISFCVRRFFEKFKEILSKILRNLSTFWLIIAFIS